MSQRLILVVDDDPVFRDLLTAVLSRADFAVITAGDGEEGLKLLDQAPDVIVTDVMMPNLDGWAFVAKVRARPEFALIPVIFLTERSDSSAQLRGLKLGADDYIPKHALLEEVVTRVRNSLRFRSHVEEIYERLGKPEVAGVTAISGNLEQLGLGALLTMLEIERKSGRILLEHDGRRGHLDLGVGLVLAAAIDGHPKMKDLDAACAMLTWSSGSFRLTPVSLTPANALGGELGLFSISHLLLEAAIRQDTAAREDSSAS